MSEYEVPFPIKVEETRSSEDIELPTKEDLEMTKAKVRQVQQGDR